MFNPYTAMLGEIPTSNYSGMQQQCIVVGAFGGDGRQSNN